MAKSPVLLGLIYNSSIFMTYCAEMQGGSWVFDVLDVNKDGEHDRFEIAESLKKMNQPHSAEDVDVSNIILMHVYISYHVC